MSHTMTVAGWKMHFNGDFSGAVAIISPDGETLPPIPFDVLAEFIGSALRDKEISRLEPLTGREYLEKMMRR
jgi:hypothetical protein